MVKTIVLTGGPCGGKTTALDRIREYFTDHGFQVFTVPEVPTLVTAAGWNYLSPNHDFYYQGEQIILELQLKLEDQMLRLAETIHDRDSIIICDRGALDISAYITPQMYDDLCQACDTTRHELLHGGRYDAVIHLVTAANGAVQYYTTANNAQRYEKADEAGIRLACELDQKCINAWAEHPNHVIIDNAGSFEHKLQRVLLSIEAVIG